MGSPEFAAEILRQLHSAGYPICAVYAQPDKPAGRGQKLLPPPVAQLAKELALPLEQPGTLKDEETVQKLRAYQPDFIVVAAYGRILPSGVLTAARCDILNVHASLLPKYRGASPVHQALLEGDDHTGVSIMRVQKELDAGPVFAKARLAIESQDTSATLMHKLSVLGAQTLLEVLPQVASGLQPVEQDHAQATFTHKITKELAVIDWQQPANRILGKIRALIPWPVAQTQIAGKILKIHAAEALSERSGKSAGTVVHLGKKGWTVATGTDDILILEVQLEGKNRVAAAAAANGLRITAGVHLGSE